MKNFGFKDPKERLESNIEHRISNIEYGVVGPSFKHEFLAEEIWKDRAKKVTLL